jgi:hypothetical protein
MNFVMNLLRRAATFDQRLFETGTECEVDLFRQLVNSSFARLGHFSPDAVLNEAMSRKIHAGQRIVAWDLGIHDLGVCVLETAQVANPDFVVPLPVPHLVRWDVTDLCPSLRKAPMDRVINELINYWMANEEDLAAADFHIIEIQFHNPKMRSLAAALQTLITLRCDAEIVHMGSDTKFTICRQIGVEIEDHKRGGSQHSHRLVTKRNSVCFANWILQQGPCCEASATCQPCTERSRKWLDKLNGALASKKDDMSDTLGLAYAAIVKYWSP